MSEENLRDEAVPRYTIVVAVYHSLAFFGECLASLARLDYPKDKYRVIALDLGNLEGVSQFAERMPEVGISFELVRLPDRSHRSSGRVKEACMNRLRNDAVASFPSEIYVFTEDDCTYEPDWLCKLDAAMTPGVGAVGGPDLLPDGMGWFATTLDCILNSPLGRVGATPAKGKNTGWYYPHKENMAIPSRVLGLIGKFPENRCLSVEMEMARRIRAAGLKLVYVDDNPVWHKRWTTLPRLLLRNFDMCKEKVHMLREKGNFYRSFHFFVFLAAVALALIGLSALFSSTGRFIFLILTGIYASYLIYISAMSATRTGKRSVGLGVLLLTPIHQLSNLLGILNGVWTKPRA